MLDVGGLELEELAVDRIAQGEALFRGTAGDGVEEKFLAIVREFELPGFAPIGGLVDSGFHTFPARNNIGKRGAKSHDPAEIERVSPWNVETMPGLTLIEGSHNYALRAGGPDSRDRRPFFA